MLEDISDGFNQVVNRPPRSSHPGARASNEALAARRRIVPIPAPPESPDGHGAAPDPAPVKRITTSPGPGEVSSPSWWKKAPSHQS
jgi:hypothetical protein